MADLLRCTQCNRAGPSVGTCGQPLTCPQSFVPVLPGGVDVVIHCSACDVTYAVSTADIMAGKSITRQLVCKGGVDNCLAKASTIKVAAPAERPLGRSPATSRKASPNVAD